MAQLDTYTVEIPASEIEDQASFEIARQNAYAQEDQLAKNESLAKLIGNAQIKGRIALADVIMETITRPDDTAKQRAEKALSRLEAISDHIATTEIARRHEEETYRITVGSDAAVIAVDHIVPVVKDSAVIARQQQMADMIGYGPKQNDSSFRTNSYVKGQRKI